MGITLLIAGIILLKTDGWFEDQHTVGEICAWAGGGILALELLAFVIVFLLGLRATR